MKYISQYKNGATVTVFAPYDCKNNCPFCVNKKDYKENPHFDMDAVITSMIRLHKITPNCDIVITGGEPFADLEKLQRLILAVAWMNDINFGQHKLFINTTLPFDEYSKETILEFIDINKEYITGLNVSRHVNKYVAECDDEIFDEIPVPVRINCVLYTQKEAAEAKDIYDRFILRKSITGIQFREDYTTTTDLNLYAFEENSTFTHILSSFNINKQPEQFFNANKIFSNDFRWNCKIVDKVSYHRTLPWSKIIYDDKQEINDIIIDPRGNIYDDWNEHGEKLDISTYKQLFQEE